MFNEILSEYYYVIEIIDNDKNCRIWFAKTFDDAYNYAKKYYESCCKKYETSYILPKNKHDRLVFCINSSYGNGTCKIRPKKSSDTETKLKTISKTNHIILNCGNIPIAISLK